MNHDTKKKALDVLQHVEGQKSNTQVKEQDVSKHTREAFAREGMAFHGLVQLMQTSVEHDRLMDRKIRNMTYDFIVAVLHAVRDESEWPDPDATIDKVLELAAPTANKIHEIAAELAGGDE